MLDDNNFTLLGSVQRHRFWMGCARMPTSPGRAKIWTLSFALAHPDCHRTPFPPPSPIHTHIDPAPQIMTKEL